MRNDFRSLTIFGNKSNQNILEDFRGLVNSYFNNISRDSYSSEGFTENTIAREARYKINLGLKRIIRASYYAKIDPSMLYSPPIGGRIQGHVNLLENIFVLIRMDINPQFLDDFLLRVLGVYQDDQRSALFRTFNPFFWLNQLLLLVTHVPFVVLGSVGFNEQKIEDSFLGRLIRFLVYVVVSLGSVLAVSDRLRLTSKILIFFHLK